MPIFNYTLPNFKFYENCGQLSNLDINIKCPDEIALSTITIKIKEDYPQPDSKSKDKNVDHYYKLYGKSWIKMENSKYQCLECGKLYKRLTSLYPHINIHRNERLYKCQHCSKTYFAQKSLRVHTSKYHSDKINWTYYCPICEKGYMAKYAFMRHLEAESAK